ncbi:MAG: phage head morphogenesis protein, partial [Erysipelotrichia bacterium]|nr:phage head morphogenesis protein [Erysipelotrichia bacterium]
TGKTVDIKGDATYNDWMDKLKDLHSDDEIEKMKQKTINLKKDTNDLSRMKSVLGASNPQILEQYQELKYNGGSEWTKLKDNYFVKSRLKDGRFGSVINSEKQSPHIKSTATKGKSYFEDDVDVQKLFDKYAGTGFVERQRDGKVRKNTELVIASDFQGIAVNLEGNFKTNMFKIHHSKNRTHIVPIKKGD